MEIRRKPGGRAGRSSSPARCVPEVTLLTSSQRWMTFGCVADMGEAILDDTYADLLLNSSRRSSNSSSKCTTGTARSPSTKSSKQTLIFTLTSCRRNRRGLPSLDVAQIWPPRPTTFSAIGAKLMGTIVQLPWCREGARSQTEQTEGERQRWRSLAQVVLPPQN